MISLWDGRTSVLTEPDASPERLPPETPEAAGLFTGSREAKQRAANFTQSVPIVAR